MNTYVLTPLNSEERIASYRSSDYDPTEAYCAHGPHAVYDLTDGMRPVAYVIARSPHHPPGGLVIALPPA